MPEQWYSTAQVAQELGINVSRVRVLAFQLGIGRKVGKAWVFTEEDLEALRTRRDRRFRDDNTPGSKAEGAW